MIDAETTKLRLRNYYGHKNLAEVESAIQAFRKENGTHTKLLLPWLWTIGYFILVFQFRVNDYCDEIKMNISKEGAGTAKQRLIRMMYRQYQIFTDYTVEESWSLYHIEGAMMCGSLEEDDEQLTEADQITDSVAVQSLRNRIARNCAKAKFLEVEFPPLELPNFGPVNRTAILNHILSTAGREIPRFTRFFGDVDRRRVVQILEEGLSPAVRRICDEGLFDIESIKSIHLVGEDPASSRHAGVYIHILSPSENALAFWLYIGQSIVLKDRVRLHKSRRHQSQHASLHYFIWNTTMRKKSDFVTLYTASHDELCPTHRQLLLNLAEMWMCCLFQTLSTVHLEKYLPTPGPKPWAGHHLNVALPLFQSFTDSPDQDAVSRQTFTELLRSTDPEIRQWAESLRDAYNQLRNSPDPNLRDYWNQQMRYSMDQDAIAQQAKSISHIQQYLSGKSCQVKFGLTCGQFTFAIPQGLELEFKQGDQVVIQFHLASSEHPRKHVGDARGTDPACRLAVSISGHDGQGRFHAWLLVKGAYKTLCKMNTLVDILEGRAETSLHMSQLNYATSRGTTETAWENFIFKSSCGLGGKYPEGESHTREDYIERDPINQVSRWRNWLPQGQFLPRRTVPPSAGDELLFLVI
ncbi:hypothetical protein P170DRAFT_463696 [Aspergillus steynii IBT 23096]|uniref:Uncharacterized protein n=1 Tax=Aspergillus steynii IBT 23096 TaxID=1392250 RepID=A0A2I2GCB2_9EURO|nr:uncharacterized protein P170DRAFT_463696 [Aspergillus steynii IBT 23096]PLB50512.1 hypothetical protein P170DRAFT_463696 [Aspergillus steynii IBT 23096]